MFDNKFHFSITDRKQKIKYLSILLLVVMVISLLLFLFTNCNSKPSGISDETYRVGSKAIEVVDDYLDYDLSRDDAYDRLVEIGSRSSAGAISVNIKSIYVGLSTDMPDSVILDRRNKLAEKIGQRQR